MHLLIAPNAFKNSLSAGEVAKAIQRGLDQSLLKTAHPGGDDHPNGDYSCECFPIGDGGDGTGDLLIDRLGGHRVTAEARDPLGRMIVTYWGLCSTSATAPAVPNPSPAVPNPNPTPTSVAPTYTPFASVVPATSPFTAIPSKYVEFDIFNSLSKISHPSPRPQPITFPPSGDSSTAVIEMANASGLRLLDRQELNPLTATSAGTGDLIRAALDQGDDATPDEGQQGPPRNKLTRIIIGMGGSATVDGGTGILQALGARFLNANGQPLQDLPGSLTDLASIDLSGLDPRLSAIDLIVLCDVNNPLTGPQGAAAIFGPQKGATVQDVQRLDAGLAQLAKVVDRQLGIDISTLPRGGTAGGAAAGLHGLLSARLVSGIDYFLEITGFDAALDRSDWVITGEGSIDDQTLQGKAPFGVARRAKEKGIPVIGLAGRLPAEISPGLKEYFDLLIPISPEQLELAEALRLTAINLERAAEQLGDWLADRPPS